MNYLLQSPASQSGKIFIGMEIVQINNQNVVSHLSDIIEPCTLGKVRVHSTSNGDSLVE